RTGTRSSWRGQGEGQVSSAVPRVLARLSELELALVLVLAHQSLGSLAACALARRCHGPVCVHPAAAAALPARAKHHGMPVACPRSTDHAHQSSHPLLVSL